MKFEKHIFVCNHEREDGAKRVSCGKELGDRIALKFKALIKEHKLKSKVRSQRSNCLDICEEGPVVVIYPEGIFYGDISEEDVNEIFEEHILNNRPVKRLQLSFKKK